MLLCGCASVPPESRTAPAPLAVDLKALDSCRQFLRKTPLPQVLPSDDAGAAFLKDDAALIGAYARMDAADHCVADVQTLYAGAGRKEKQP